MPKAFPLEIVTPEKRFYAGDAEIVIVRTLSGDEGFMAGHAWACKLLATGEVWFRETSSKEFRYAAISEGFIDVRGNVMIYTDAAEWPEEIDVSRAEKKEQLERDWLEKHKDYLADPEFALEVEVHKQAITRALNRKKVADGEARQKH